MGADEMLSQFSSESHRKSILFLARGEGPYDEFFSRVFDSFAVTFATFNPKPTVKVPFISLSGPLSFLYKYQKARFIIYSLGDREVNTLLKKDRPDLLVGSYASTYGFVSAKTEYHPFVLIAYGSDILLEPKNLFLRKRVSLALSRADLVILDSDVVEKAAINLGVKQDRILKFPRFDALWISAIKNTNGSFKSNHGYTDKRIILHTRWFETVYNVETVVEAFALVNKKIRDTVLVLVGDGSKRGNIKTLVDRLGLSHCVYFTGRLEREEVIALNDEADVYVSASLSDGTSSSLIEAICRGTPVVVSDSDGNREWIKDGVTGTLFNPTSHLELAEKIIVVLQEPNIYKQMAFQAKSDVFARANWQTNRNGLIEKLNELTE